MKGVLPQLAALARSLQRDAVADRFAGAAILDLVTAAAAAPRRSLAAALRASYGSGTAAFWFSGEQAAPAAAAFANSFAAAALDLDDGHRLSRGHPGSAVIPAVFAEADRLQAAGQPVEDGNILHAIVVGYEVSVRIASARSFYARTGYWGGYGAAAGVATLRGVNTDTFAAALAIAGETSPQMLTTTAGPAWPQPDGSDVKEGVPWSSANGFVAVGLAEAGLLGPLDMLDHEPFFDGAAILAPRPTLAIEQVYTKFYCCCRHVHAPIDALLALMSADGIAAREIAAIEVHSHRGALRIANRVDPRHLADVQYSIPYCLALVALRGAGVLLPLTESSLHDREAKDLASRVVLSIDDKCDARFPAETAARIVLHARGRTYSSEVTTPRGEANDPVPWPDRLAKFEQATRLSLDDEERRDFLRAIEAVAAGELAPLRRRLALRTRASRPDDPDPVAAGQSSTPAARRRRYRS